MSKSFRFFRKNSKLMMAGLVVLCMGLFVFSAGSGGGGGGDPTDAGATVVTWNGGSINQQDLGNLVRQRLITDQVLRRLFVEGGGQTGYDFPQRIPNFFLQSQSGFPLEQEIVNTEIVADLAAKAGIRISDASVNDYLKEIGLRNVDTGGIQAVIASAGQGNGRQIEAIVFSTLRKLLAAHYYQQGYSIAGFVVTPQQRWEDWRRVNERISLSIAELPVEDFVDDINDEPTDAQLTALYNDFKDAEPNQLMNAMGQPLDNPDPGFREPRRVRLQFILGSVTELSGKLEASITEEEIKDYYERNKRTEFVKSDLFGDDAPSESDDEASDAAGGEGDSSDSTDADPDADAADAGAGDANDAAPADGSAPAEEAAPAPGDGDSSQDARKSPFRLAALQTTAAPAEDAAASASNAEAPNDQADDATESETEGAADLEGDDADADGAGAGEASDDADEDADEPPVEYEPLDKVRDEIKRRLATDKAVEQLEKTMGELMAQLLTDTNRYASALAEARELEKKAPQPPEKLSNLKPLAEARGLTFERTALLTARELSETAVGKARDVQVQRPLLTAVFTDLGLYEPILARDLNGDWYLASKVEDEPARTPPFAEAKDAVVAAWKRREAAKLAEKKAQELAAEAEKADAPFDEYFKTRGFKVIPQTEMFSWRYYPGANAGQGSPILSPIPELKSIGPDFMDAAFKLDGNETAGLLNFDQSAAYVIRLHSRQYTTDELKNLFLEEANRWLGQYDMAREHAYEFGTTAMREIIDDRAGRQWDETWFARRQQESLRQE